MIVQCTQCGSRFDVDAAALGPKGRKLRCSRCKAVFFQPAPGETPAPAPTPPPPPPPPSRPKPAPSPADDDSLRNELERLADETRVSRGEMGDEEEEEEQGPDLGFDTVLDRLAGGSGAKPRRDKPEDEDQELDDLARELDALVVEDGTLQTAQAKRPPSPALREVALDDETLLASEGAEQDFDAMYEEIDLDGSSSMASPLTDASELARVRRAASRDDYEEEEEEEFSGGFSSSLVDDSVVDDMADEATRLTSDEEHALASLELRGSMNLDDGEYGEEDHDSPATHLARDKQEKWYDEDEEEEERPKPAKSAKKDPFLGKDEEDEEEEEVKPRKSRREPGKPSVWPWVVAALLLLTLAGGSLYNFTGLKQWVEYFNVSMGSSFKLLPGEGEWLEFSFGSVLLVKGELENSSRNSQLAPLVKVSLLDQEDHPLATAIVVPGRILEKKDLEGNEESVRVMQQLQGDVKRLKVPKVMPENKIGFQAIFINPPESAARFQVDLENAEGETPGGKDDAKAKDEAKDKAPAKAESKSH